jgi:two-component system nitrogen regulation response regulator GlnG
MARLLVVDDDAHLCTLLRHGLRPPGSVVRSAGSAGEALAAVERQRPDAVLLDVCLPDGCGLEALARLRRLDPALPVIVFTGHATPETAIAAVQGGAFDYLVKPVGLAVLRAVIGRALAAGPRGAPPAAAGPVPARVPAGMVGNCPAMQEVYKAIGRVAGQDVAVLIRGESGTGKELVARAVHAYSRRADGPFVAVNCAALPEPLVEGELFGHEKGAFTGAERRHAGKFEQADGGTLFLDEVGDMPPAAQAKVLRLLQAQRFERLGGRDPVTTDVRVLAATNQDLARLMARGRFRADLFHRLRVADLRLPPLRERRGDVPLLVAHFLRELGGGLGKPGAVVEDEALALLDEHAWPGNVRELRASLQLALVQAPDGMVRAACLREYLHAGEAAPEAPPCAAAVRGSGDWVEFVRGQLEAGGPDLYRRLCGEMERAVLEAALQQSGGCQVRAAALLGLPRNTLRDRLRAAGLVAPRARLGATRAGT